MAGTESENPEHQVRKPPDSAAPDRTASAEGVDLAGQEDAGQEDPDVVLDVPKLDVEEITLQVEDLRAKVSLQVEVLDMVRLSVGADVELGKVDLGIRGVQAQAFLKVHLRNVTRIVQDVLRTVDNNPELVRQLASSLEHTAAATASGVGEAVGESAKQLGPGGARPAVRAGSTVRHVRRRGERAAHAAGRYARTAGRATRSAAGSARSKVGSLSRRLRRTRRS